MKKIFRNFGIIVLFAIMTLFITACPSSTSTSDDNDDLSKEVGALVSIPELASKTHYSITIKASAFTDGNPGKQTIEYAINSSNSVSGAGWQDGLIFSGLGPSTTYWIFARSKSNASHDAGSPSAGLIVTTDPLLSLGDIGPGGGIIFYVDPSGFTVEGYTGETGSYPSYTAYYLEVAPVDSSASAQWGYYNSELISGITTFTSNTSEDFNKIGNGRKDTLTIVAYLANTTETGRAAQLAAAEASGGKNDWFLPSCGELNLLYEQRNLPGIGITSGRYWSSSQYDYIMARIQYFSDGIRFNDMKQGTNRVRAIRAF